MQSASGEELKERLVSVFPEVQHRCADGLVASVTLRRSAGRYSAECAGCKTRFIYRKPTAARRPHFRSPLLPEVKGNFDDGD